MNEDETKNLQELIKAKKERLHQLELKEARYGLDVPPHIPIEIEELRGEIQALRIQLEALEKGQKAAPRPEKARRQAPTPAKPRRPVNWERVGAIASVIAVLIALGTWLVPNAADFLSAWLSKTPTATPTTTPTTVAAVKPPTNTPLVTPTSSPTHTPVISAATPTHTPFPPIVTPTFTPPPTSTSTPAPTWTPTPPPGMVYVPAGDFIMGSSDTQVDSALALCNEEYGDCKRSWFEDEYPQHTVYLDAFYIDRTEVTNAEYQKCVEAGVCSQPHDTDWYNDPNRAEHPVVWVDWNEAGAYCEWAGKRLPTEAEWEKAARGTDGWIYPWGNTSEGSKLNFCGKNCPYDRKGASVDDGYVDTAPVGSYPAGASPYGALDMAGNVAEWVADWYYSDYYSYSPYRNPTGPSSGESRVLRSGSWSNPQVDTRCTARGGYPLESRHVSVGFRCARDSQSQ